MRSSRLLLLVPGSGIVMPANRNRRVVVVLDKDKVDGGEDKDKANDPNHDAM